MNNIVFEHVVKAYGKSVIVNDLNMEIREGERLILLGPSGCGKSTTLRMIAGLEDVTSGSLHMRGQVVNNIPCGDRGVSMVFQNYALFPHMTVKANIIYGLKAHKMEPAEISRRLEEVLEMLQLKGLEDRKPKDLRRPAAACGPGPGGCNTGGLFSSRRAPLQSGCPAAPAGQKGTGQDP